jgi:hypothetical protein
MFTSIARLLDRAKLRHSPREVEVIADDDGVRVVLDDRTISPKFHWSDVTEIRTFKVGLITVDDIRLAFQADGTWHEFSEDWKGFGQLSAKMRENFPGVPADWFAEVMHPPFATNEEILFRRIEPERS